MYLRLAFAVAAHLESEILIVDEVLAVGDTEFQRKCLGKMGEVTKEQGRTVLFVSHNMAAIQNLCSRNILLHNGLVMAEGNTQKIVVEYLKTKQVQSNIDLSKLTKRKGMEICTLFMVKLAMWVQMR